MARLLVSLLYLWLAWLLVVAGFCALLAFGGGHFRDLGVQEALSQLLKITTVFFGTSLPFYLPFYAYRAWRAKQDAAAQDAANTEGTPCERCQRARELRHVRYGISEGYLLVLAREKVVEGLFCRSCIAEVVDAGLRASRAGFWRSLRGPLCYLITASNARYVLAGEDPVSDGQST